MNGINEIIRYALVRGRPAFGATLEENVAAYLPGKPLENGWGYRVLGVVTLQEPWGDEYKAVVIGGRDYASWDLDHYVIPRLGSGMFVAQEIDLSHPAMKQIAYDGPITQLVEDVDRGLGSMYSE